MVTYVRSVVALVHCKVSGERQKNVIGSEARILSSLLDGLGCQDKVSYKKHKGCFTNAQLSTALLSSWTPRCCACRLLSGWGGVLWKSRASFVCMPIFPTIYLKKVSGLMEQISLCWPVLETPVSRIAWKQQTEESWLEIQCRARWNRLRGRSSSRDNRTVTMWDEKKKQQWEQQSREGTR